MPFWRICSLSSPFSCLDIQRITIEFSFDFDPVNHAPIAGPIRILKILSETFGATAKVNNLAASFSLLKNSVEKLFTFGD
jgi:hypothetical protein